MIEKWVKRYYQYEFLFRELVKRDFKQKYKRTSLGMLWSVLSPLMTLFVMKIVFTQFFGRHALHYTTYLFSGTLVLNYYKEATKTGMTSLIKNRKIIEKINLPKYLFLLSKNVSAFVNFLITMVVYFFFCLIDGIEFGPRMFTLIYPIIIVTLMNIGVGMILSALCVFFKDTKYLYDIFLTLLTYVSAIFYTLDKYSPQQQRLFLLNPVFVIIKYFRTVVIDCKIPSLEYHGLMLFYAVLFLGVGGFLYKRYNREFIYYL